MMITKVNFKSFVGRKCRLAEAIVGPVDNEKVHFVFETDNGGKGGAIEGFEPRPRIGENAEQLTVSLERVLGDFGAPSTIDYLSLDIEGAEWWAFAKFPWHKYVFLSITVERPRVELRRKLLEVSRIQQGWPLREYPNLFFRASGAGYWFYQNPALLPQLRFTSPLLLANLFAGRVPVSLRPRKFWGCILHSQDNPEFFSDC